MKNFTQKVIGLFAILFAMSFKANSQDCTLPPPYIDNTGINMTIVLTPGVINEFPSNIIDDSYIVAYGETNGIYVGSWFMNDVQNGTLAFPVWGDDAATSEINGLVSGESINFQLVSDTSLYDLDLAFAGPNAYVSNSILPAISASYSLNCNLPQTPGCTDPLAIDFNPAATVDDGSCILSEGCTNPSALNYDPDATVDDGSCILSEGCTNPSALNYDPDAIVDDGSCILSEGCTNPSALNYDPDAIVDDGSCILSEGCTNPSAINYDPDAIVDDGSCILSEGCTNPSALNYDPDAIIDNGSCAYLETQLSSAFSQMLSNAQVSNIFINDISGLGIGIIDSLPEIGLCTSIAMATGGVESISTESFGGIGGPALDQDLTLQLENVGATNTSLNNLITIEFDFIPNSDEISFEYVFASKEYPGFTCSEFNDVFGFFISGPGISGPFSNGAMNLALVPDPISLNTYTNTPVIINTINSGTPSLGDPTPCDNIDPNWQDYSVFYTDNPNNETINFPGYTIPLTASMSGLTLGEEYHIKFAIADVGDGALNSAVFIQSNCNIEGCLDSTAFNYNPLANIDDGSCEALILGCMDSLAFNWNPLANTDDESCLISGCTDSLATNYNPDAIADDLQCEYPCNLPSPYVDNTGVNMTIVLTPAVINQFPSHVIDGSYIIAFGENNGIYVGSWFMDDVQNGTLAFPVWGDDNSTNDVIEGLVSGESINFQLVSDTSLYDLDLTFAGPNTYISNSILPAISASYSLNCNYIDLPGCTEESASNYNPIATSDDGSCFIDEGIFEGNGFYIPDGSGISYSSTVNVIGFDSLLNIDNNDYIEVCVEIEHSYLGDLQLELTSPNGVSVILHSYGSGGGGTWLGNALDGDATETPGECWNYCWNTEPQFGTFANSPENTIIAPNGNPSMIAGSYAPEDNFSNFDGTLLNGSWTLTITDNLQIDNGFVCNWDVNFSLGENIYGCTVIDAFNYNPDANFNDGSCEFDIFGCTDSLYLEYDSIANTDNGSCETPIIFGCTDSLTFNYDSSANSDDGSCIYYGCTDPSFLEYDSTINIDDGSCVTPIILGCTDSLYANFNPLANSGDGSCDGCMAYSIDVIIRTGYWAGEIGWDIIDFNGNTIVSNPFGTYLNQGNSVIIESFCINYADNFPMTPHYTFNAYDSNTYSNSVGWAGEGSYEVLGKFPCDPDYQAYSIPLTIMNSINSQSTGFNVPSSNICEIGCTNSSALNFNAEANLDDGSCVILGCTNETAINYNPLANQNAIQGEESACEIFGCTLTNFPNYNPVATIDDGSCDEGSNDIFGCTDSLYVEYNPSANQDNNSCETIVILGCTNPYSQGGLFNPLANVDDGSCILIGCSDSMYLEYYTQGFTPSIDEDTYNDLFCNEIAVFGCTDSLYLEYNFEANINNESCIIIAEYGCMDQIAFNFNSNANIDDGSCEYSNNFFNDGYNSGWIDGYNIGLEDGVNNFFNDTTYCDEIFNQAYAIGYNEALSSIDTSINVDEIYLQGWIDSDSISQLTIDSLLNEFASEISQFETAENHLDSLQILLSDANSQIEILELLLIESNSSENCNPIYIDLQEGWNIIGYTLPEPQDVAATLESISSEIEILKDNNADVYWPEFGFNGIGDFIPGYGYQLKLGSNILGYTYPDVGDLKLELTPQVPQWVLDMEVDIHPNDIRTLVRVVNILGQEVNPQNQPKGTVLIYLYNDATIEKKIVK